MIDHDYEIDTDELTVAATKIDAVWHMVGDVPSVLEAHEQLVEAAAALGDLDGFEEPLRQMVRHVERAAELIDGYRVYAERQHQLGRVRISAENYEQIRRSCVEAHDACERWVSYADGELREIA